MISRIVELDLQRTAPAILLSPQELEHLEELRAAWERLHVGLPKGEITVLELPSQEPKP